MTDDSTSVSAAARDAIVSGRCSLGIELGSTRIKACLVGDHAANVLASGSHAWESVLLDGKWTYSLDSVWSGLQAVYADLVGNVERQYGVVPTTFAAIGVSAMMHGYLAFYAQGVQLVPFRTWRNTTTDEAAAELSRLFEVNIPLRWSVAHLHQAILDEEPHTADIDFLTTLAGYVHWTLTGRRVLGVGDASGMFPVDSASRDYDEDLLRRYHGLVADRAPWLDLRHVLPEVMVAGSEAGHLTDQGAARLDPTGRLKAGTVFCPPEGDAGTGMVATAAVAPRTANVSAGTSIFAMAVLEHPLERAHHEIDMVTTPAGDPVAMVHCNNGAHELAQWSDLLTGFASAAGADIGADQAFELLFRQALAAESDAGGLVAYNYLAGEPVAGLTEGRPLVVRAPGSHLSLPNFARAQIYGVFGTLCLGMRVLAEEGTVLDLVQAHGGIFRTAGVAQRFLAAALDTPVAVADTAAEGGAWGIAVLASYVTAGPSTSLSDYLQQNVFDAVSFDTVRPDPHDVTGFATYLDRYRDGLAIQETAIGALSPL